MLTNFTVSNYRSIKKVHLKLRPITVIVGSNGSGKSNLYRAIKLASCAATGQISKEIAQEGGINSVLSATRRYKNEKAEVELNLKSDRFSYDLVFGKIPPQALPGNSYFGADLDIKQEKIKLHTGTRSKVILHRRRQSIEATDTTGELTDYTTRVASNQSVLASLREPHKYPLLDTVASELRNYRFYDHIRTDDEAPGRMPQPGMMTGALANDASNLASAIASILMIGDSDLFERSFDHAFPGAKLKIKNTNRGLALLLHSKGMERCFDANEISDGTLQYISLLTVLLSLEPPPLIALNEPETSIHNDLIEPLAKLIVEASKRSQIWITTHSTVLSDYILEYGGYGRLLLKNIDGDTRIEGVDLLSEAKENPDEDEDEDEEAELELNED